MFEEIEAQNLQIIDRVYEALNALDTKCFVDFMAEDAVLISLNDTVPPLQGIPDISKFFADFFERGTEINFEVIGRPQALGNLVTYKHIDSFEFDGVRRDDFYVSVVLIVDGKIRKWLGYLQDTPDA